MAHAHDGNHDALTAVGRLFAIGVALNVGFVILEASMAGARDHWPCWRMLFTT
jgi:hypothetical protein